MTTGITAIRFVACLLLVLLAAQVLSCDVLSSSSCWLGNSGSSDDLSPRHDDDACLCCCRHAICLTAFEFDPGDAITRVAVPPTASPDALLAFSVYHPPKA